MNNAKADTMHMTVCLHNKSRLPHSSAEPELTGPAQESDAVTECAGDLTAC